MLKDRVYVVFGHGDNLNANGAAPVAPYVFLSFLFEIVVEFMFLLCILLLC